LKKDARKLETDGRMFETLATGVGFYGGHHQTIKMKPSITSCMLQAQDIYMLKEYQ